MVCVLSLLEEVQALEAEALHANRRTAAAAAAAQQPPASPRSPQQPPLSPLSPPPPPPAEAAMTPAERLTAEALTQRLASSEEERGRLASEVAALQFRLASMQREHYSSSAQHPPPPPPPPPRAKEGHAAAQLKEDVTKRLGAFLNQRKGAAAAK